MIVCELHHNYVIFMANHKVADCYYVQHVYTRSYRVCVHACVCIRVYVCAYMHVFSMCEVESCS